MSAVDMTGVGALMGEAAPRAAPGPGASVAPEGGGDFAGTLHHVTNATAGTSTGAAGAGASATSGPAPVTTPGPQDVTPSTGDGATPGSQGAAPGTATTATPPQDPGSDRPDPAAAGPDQPASPATSGKGKAGHGGPSHGGGTGAPALPTTPPVPVPPGAAVAGAQSATAAPRSAAAGVAGAPDRSRPGAATMGSAPGASGLSPVTAVKGAAGAQTKGIGRPSSYAGGLAASGGPAERVTIVAAPAADGAGPLATRRLQAPSEGSVPGQKVGRDAAGAPPPAAPEGRTEVGSTGRTGAADPPTRAGARVAAPSDATASSAGAPGTPAGPGSPGSRGGAGAVSPVVTAPLGAGAAGPRVGPPLVPLPQGVSGLGAPVAPGFSSESLPGVAGQLLSVLSPPRPAANGAYTVTVSLRPESLGEVQATVTAGQDQVAVRLVASTPSGAAAIQQALPQLHEALSQGIQRATVSLAGANSGAAGQQGLAAGTSGGGGAPSYSSVAPRLERNVPPSSRPEQPAGTAPPVGFARRTGTHLVDVRV